MEAEDIPIVPTTSGTMWGDIIIKLSNEGASGRGKTSGEVWKKISEKHLTNEFESDIILKLLSESGTQQKLFWKNFEKVLDKGFELWYNIKAVPRGRANSILKIKQCKKSNDPWDSFAEKAKK